MCQSNYRGHPRPPFRLFSTFFKQILQQIKVKNFIQRMVPGFELTTFRKWVSPITTTPGLPSCLFLKIPASFCLFSSLSHYNCNNTNWKKLGIRTQDGSATKPRSYGSHPVSLMCLLFSFWEREPLVRHFRPHCRQRFQYPPSSPSSSSRNYFHLQKFRESKEAEIAQIFIPQKDPFLERKLASFLRFSTNFLSLASPWRPHLVEATSR